MSINQNNNSIASGLYSLIIFLSCTYNQNNCLTQTSIEIKTTDSQPCIATGSIMINSPQSAGNKYKIENGIYQTNNFFINLRPGIYRILVKDDKDCETTKKIRVDTIPKGIKFDEVQEILEKNCASCHSGVNPQAGLDFTQVCDILNQWERIQARAIEGNPGPMPPTGLISMEERFKISNWIKLGHNYEE